MQHCDIPSDEKQRLSALNRYQILDSNPESDFDDLTQLASYICDTPIALISLVDQDRQWFKSKKGFEPTETARDISFCGHAIHHPNDPLVVPNTLEDKRFFDNPLVTSDYHVRFYAGAPLLTSDGQAIGTLCVIDQKPRNLSPEQLEALKALGRQVIAQMELRVQLENQAVEQERRLNLQKTLVKIAHAIRQSLNIKTICQTTANEICKILDLERIVIYRSDNNVDEDLIIESTSSTLEPSIVIHEPNEDSIRLQVLGHFNNSGRIITDIQSKASLLTPIFQNEQLWGILACFEKADQKTWLEDELELLRQIAEQLGIALQQAEYINQMELQTIELKKLIQSLAQSQAQLVQQEKLAGLGQLVAGIAHEINNPVNFIYGNISYAQTYAEQLMDLIQLYQEKFPNPGADLADLTEELDIDFLMEDLPKLLSSMKSGATRIQQIVSSLRVFSRMDEAEMKEADIHEGINSTLMILQHRLKKSCDRAEIVVNQEYENLPKIECFPGQLNQVFMNILSNAIDALEDSLENQSITYPQITISTRLDSPNKTDERVVISISDNAGGMHEKVQDCIFNPFFTTKAVGKGTGLGLSISYQIVVDKHQGSLLCHSHPGKGTEFLITVPRYQSSLCNLSSEMSSVYVALNNTSKLTRV